MFDFGRKDSNYSEINEGHRMNFINVTGMENVDNNTGYEYEQIAMRRVKENMQERDSNFQNFISGRLN